MGKDGSPIVTCAKTGEEITLIQCSKCWLYGRCPYGYDFLTRKEQEQMEWEIACAEQRSYHVPEPPPPPCDHAVVIKPIQTFKLTRRIPGRLQKNKTITPPAYNHSGVLLYILNYTPIEKG